MDLKVLFERLPLLDLFSDDEPEVPKSGESTPANQIARCGLARNRLLSHSVLRSWLWTTMDNGENLVPQSKGTSY